MIFFIIDYSVHYIKVCNIHWSYPLKVRIMEILLNDKNRNKYTSQLNYLELNLFVHKHINLVFYLFTQKNEDKKLVNILKSSSTPTLRECFCGSKDMLILITKCIQICFWITLINIYWSLEKNFIKHWDAFFSSNQ